MSLETMAEFECCQARIDQIKTPKESSSSVAMLSWIDRLLDKSNKIVTWLLLIAEFSHLPVVWTTILIDKTTSLLSANADLFRSSFN